MNPGTTRSVQRAVHLLAGAIIVAYIYTPLNDAPLGGIAAKVAAAPLVVASGMAMWHMARLRAALRRRAHPTRPT